MQALTDAKQVNPEVQYLMCHFKDKVSGDLLHAQNEAYSRECACSPVPSREYPDSPFPCISLSSEVTLESFHYVWLP